MRSGTDIGAMNNKSAVVALVEVTLIGCCFSSRSNSRLVAHSIRKLGVMQKELDLS